MPKKLATSLPANPASPIVIPSTTRVMDAINLADVKESALRYIDDILEHYLPYGYFEGSEYVSINPTRHDHDEGSFKFNVQKGVWSDFATGDAGDILELIKYLNQDDDYTVYDAARELQTLIEQWEGTSGYADRKGHATAKRELAVAKASEYTPIFPVPENAPAAPAAHFSLGTPSFKWAYNDASGKLLGYICRFDVENKKEIRPLTFCQSVDGACAWKWQGFSTPRPLYRLDRLAANPDAPIVFVEGEKAADAAQKLLPGYVAVTTMHGAKSPDKSDFSPLIGRKSVVIWPDNDEAGMEYAKKVTSLIHAVDPNIKVITLPQVTQQAGFSEDGTAILNENYTHPQGWDAADALAEGWTEEHVWQMVQNIQMSATHSPAALALTDCPNYRIGNAGFTFDVSGEGVHKVIKKENRNGEIAERLTWISSRIDVIAQIRDVESDKWGLRVSFKDADGCTHLMSIPKELLVATEGVIPHLVKQGLRINPTAKADLNTYMMLAEPKERYLGIDRPGWYRTASGNTFVLPNKSYGLSSEPVVLQSASPSSMAVYEQKNSLADWQRFVAAPCQGNTRLVMSMCIALSGPLLYLLNEENGGFHLRGNSSVGKSTALKVACSVWGGASFLRLWRATSNGLEGTCVVHNDTFLGLDELAQIDPHQAGEVAYMLANGKGKSRADRSGMSVIPHVWRLLFLSTGEISLADHMASIGRQIRAGQDTRLIDIPADAGKGLGLFEDIHGVEAPGAFANQMVTAASEYYGHAGPALVEIITDPTKQTEILAQLRAEIDQFKLEHCPADASGQVIRVLHRFALVAAVGKFCCLQGILPWPEHEPGAAAACCFNTWLSSRGNSGRLEDDQMVDQAKRFLELHGESRFTTFTDIDTEQSQQRTFNRAGFCKIIGNGSDSDVQYYILPEVFRSEVCSGFNPTEVIRVLHERGHLETDSSGKPQVLVRIPNNGIKRVYIINPSLMNS